jgi:regulator of sigma E protease
MDLFQTVVTIVLFFLILGTLVVIHELGHFVTARLAGVRVLEFGIGFPPRARVLRSEGETLYTLNWLPIGGFVKLEGEDGDEADDPRSFVNARLPVRLIILIAGVAMNVLLAFAIFFSIAWLATPFIGVRFQEVQPDSPAATAGLRPGDAIVSIDGQRFDFYGASVLDVLPTRAGETVMLGVDRADGGIEQIPVTLRSPDEIGPDTGALGISSSEAQPFEAHFYGEYASGRPIDQAFGIAARETGRWFGLILDGLRQLGQSIVTNPTAPPPAAGPIGIAVQLGETFWTLGPIFTLYLAGILSANLALVNALPFPPLDGGRMLVIVLRSVIGERLSVRVERLTYVVGFVFLFAFLIWITGFDLIRELGGNQ